MKHKQLFENWRKYLNEERRWGDVAELGEFNLTDVHLRSIINKGIELGNAGKFKAAVKEFDRIFDENEYGFKTEWGSGGLGVLYRRRAVKALKGQKEAGKEKEKAGTEKEKASKEKDAIARIKEEGITLESTIYELKVAMNIGWGEEKSLDQSDATDKFLQKTYKEIGLTVLDVATVGVGSRVARGSEIIWEFYKDVNKRKRKGELDDIERYPVMDILDMDTAYTSLFKKDVINGFDEAYHEKLEGLEEDVQLKNIQNIDDFVAEHLTNLTSGRIVVSYKGKKE